MNRAGALRWSCRIAVTALLVVVAPVNAQRPVLAGAVELRAERAGWVNVHLDREIDWLVSEGPAFDWQFAAGGDLRLLALRADLPGPDGTRPTAMFWDIGGTLYGESSTRFLPAGGYRLHVISEKPAVAQLRIKGPRGRQGLTPEHAVTLVHATPGEGPSALPLTSIGFAFFGPERRLLYGVFRLHVEPGGDLPDRYEPCFVVLEPQNSASYDHGCPGGFSDALLPSGDVAAAKTSALVAFRSDGEVGYGANASGADAAPRLNATGVAYTFDDPALALAAPPPAPDATRGPSAWATLPTGRARVRRGSARVPVACLGAEPCVGILRAAGRSVRFRVGAGEMETVAVRVSRHARRLEVVLSGRTRSGALLRVSRTVRLVRGRVGEDSRAHR